MKIFIRAVIVSLVVLMVAVGIAVKLRHSSTAKVGKQNALVVHEWGTFTSIAGKNGVALEWRPLNGSADLPRFVHTIQTEALGLRHSQTKADLTALVRMETPVLYFYSNEEMNVSAQVDFRKGKITEWYPQARAVGTGVNWGNLKVAPGASFTLPADYSDNHYYAARETDAAPVQVCGSSGKAAEQEKFLFYRGVGSFDLPLSVKLEKDRIVLRNSSKDQVARLLIFENRSGRVGYRVIDNFSGESISERPALDQNLDSVIRDLKQSLVASGLYDKEAEAMIKTWRNSWFEEGMRVFYILPRRITDAVLPINIDPQPAELVRVLVGRTEVITPEMEKSVEKQVKMLSDPSPRVREEARLAIQKYGRFSEPILKRIIDDERNPVVRARIKRMIEVAPSRAE